MMKVFDFDNTLYHGESSLDFYFFMVRDNHRILRCLPVILWNTVKYKLCIVDRERLEKTINSCLKVMIKDRQSVERLIASFWPKYEHKLDKKMLRLVGKEDLIFSAGPRFLLDGIRERLGTRNIICTEVDLDCREIVFFNFKDNKMKRFQEQFGNQKIDTFFTDSYNDKAMMEISEKVFIVKKGRISQIKDVH